MIKGKIIKGISSFYYVKAENGHIFECKARGIFRKDNIIPVVGDGVMVDIKDDDTGVIVEISKRENYLIRPPVANVDLSIIVFSFTRPDPNLNLLDRFLVALEKKDIGVSICFNKSDLTDNINQSNMISIYESAGYDVICTSTKTGEGLRELKERLKNNTSVFAGPSGVGKSSLLNSIQSGLRLRTGDISQKAERGKHTTRHVELLELDFGGSVLDTPGFSSLEVGDIDEEELAYLFPEFEPYIADCRFSGCRHLNEPYCEIKNQVKTNGIAPSRYDSYLLFLKEIQEQRRY